MEPRKIKRTAEISARAGEHQLALRLLLVADKRAAEWETTAPPPSPAPLMRVFSGAPGHAGMRDSRFSPPPALTPQEEGEYTSEQIQLCVAASARFCPPPPCVACIATRVRVRHATCT